MYPVIGITGKAGSGKDTLAKLIGDYRPVQNIALADPIKRFALQFFGFTEEQLWGPSEGRKAVSPGCTMFGGYSQVTETVENWLQSVQHYNGPKHLVSWYQNHVLGTPPEARTARHILQTLGTEFGRDLDPDIWVRQALLSAEHVLGGRCYDRTLGRGDGQAQNPPEAVVVTDVRFRNEALAIKKLGGTVIRVVNPKAPEAVGNHRSESEMDSIPESWYNATVVNDKSLGLQHFADKTQTLIRDLFSPRF